MIPITMRNAQHEIQKSRWRELIRECKQSGKSVRSWCLENDVKQSSYYYWLKILREESLIQAGTLAVSKPNGFVELVPKEKETNASNNSLCARLILDSGHQMDIYNGADEQTLALMLRLMKSRC